MTTSRNKINDQELEFLLKEYSECFDQMRHYMSQGMSYIKYAFTLYFAIIAAGYALFDKFDCNNKEGNYIISLLLFLGFIMGVINRSFIIGNRVYFVSVTRQVNRIRNYCLENLDTKFSGINNLNFKNDKPDHYNPQSTDTLLLVTISIINSLFLSTSLVFIEINFVSFASYWTLIILATAICVGIIQYKKAVGYLKSKDEQKAHEAIHES